MRSAPLLRRLTLTVLAATSAPGSSSAADLTARGLDVFVLAPRGAPAGARIPIEVRAYGFPEVVRAVPLPGAIVEAVWDPDSVHADLEPVRATCDQSGRAHLEVTVPPGDPAPLLLLISVRSGGRQRTQEITVERRRERELRLFLGETRVVPGSIVPVWVLESEAATRSPVADAPIMVELLEGGVTRWHRQGRTDDGGSALFRVPIPEVREPRWSWTLRATSVEDGALQARGEITLSLRDETPATPVLSARFTRDELLPGEETGIEVSLQDASGRPIEGAAFAYWIGSPGAEPKAEEDWDRLATIERTGAGGRWIGAHRAPTTVSPKGATLLLRARTEIDGHALDVSQRLSIAAPSLEVELLPEGKSLVPGLTQRVFLRLIDAKGAPIRGELDITGDGLAVRAQTDAHGEAELRWAVPREVGAAHDAGLCASGVAATVRISARGSTRLGKSRSVERCVPVDRRARTLLVADRPLLRAGESVRVRVLGGRGRSFHLLGEGVRGGATFGAALADGEQGGTIRIPAGALGLVRLTAITPGQREERPAELTLLVLPASLPQVSGTLSGGRLAPGGFAEIDVELKNERGEPLTGAVAAAVVDRFGGGHSGGWLELDTRAALTANLAVDSEREAAFLEGDTSQDPWRRAVLSQEQGAPAQAQRDPAGVARDDFEEIFANIVKALESEVFEASEDPERLLDVRRRSLRGFELNPELLTLVTAEMDPPPETPGGEPVTLADLVALDPQVRFDNVARRITRLKLFRVLQALRDVIYERRLMPDELALREPRALLARLVSEERIDASMLLDPWGHALRFVESHAAPVPFLSLIPGFRLTSAGADGVFGTRDDLADPFERVLDSGTLYADSVQEDLLVDARSLMVVGDETVEAWRQIFDQLTGHEQGGLSGSAYGEGAGMGGLGTRGYGSGGGGLARTVHSISAPPATWLPPIRTDPQGRVRIRVPLGALETTWRVVLLATPDEATPAVGMVDVPVSLPLAIRVDAGRSWIAGDSVVVQVGLHNRTAQPLQVRLSAEARGSAELLDPAPARSVAVAPASAVTVPLRVQGSRAGEAALLLEANAEGVPGDRVELRWPVLRAGEARSVWAGAWVDGEADLRLEVHPRLEVIGPARLELDTGIEKLVGAALESLAPDRLPREIDRGLALETAGRVAEEAQRRGWQQIAARAEQMISEAQGRMLAAGSIAGGKLDWRSARRIARWGRARAETTAALGAIPGCPPSLTGLEAQLQAIALEPVPARDTVPACWDSLATEVSVQVARAGSAEALARALLAFADRPHRQALARAIFSRLHVLTGGGEGPLVLPRGESLRRDARALVSAAILIGSPLAEGAAVDVVRALARLRSEQDPSGGFGSAEATRAAVLALLASPSADRPPHQITVEAPEQRPLILDRPSAVTLGASVRGLRVTTEGGGVLARLTLPVLRPWSVPPLDPSPLHAEVTWPVGAKVGVKQVVRLSLRHDLPEQALLEVRIRLPPGAELAERVNGLDVVQRAGVITIRQAITAGRIETVLELPLRFRLAGQLTAPEVEVQVVGEAITPAFARAQVVEVKPR
ncbi:MAG: hypothetical protein IT384_08900 [Deltaproteobacteria bacterium]|nr:hypothetical protein [Deltaproteobacteria bacterium]